MGPQVYKPHFFLWFGAISRADIEIKQVLPVTGRTLYSDGRLLICPAMRMDYSNLHFE